MASTKQRDGRASADPKRPFNERHGVLMTPAELADYLGITERQARRKIAEGEIARVKVGKLVRVHIADADAYIAAQRTEMRR